MRVLQIILLSLSLIFAPVPISNVGEQKAYAQVETAAAVGTAEVVILFTAVGLVIASRCAAQSPATQSFAQDVSNRIRDMNDSLVAQFHTILAKAKLQTETFCRRAPPPILLPLDTPAARGFPNSSTSSNYEAAQLFGLTTQVLQSPFMIGMELAYADLLRQYGLDLTTTIGDYEVLQPKLAELAKNAAFVEAFEKLTEAYSQAISKALPLPFTTWLAEKTSRTMNCLKDPQSWKFFLAGVGHAGDGLLPILWILETMRVKPNVMVVAGATVWGAVLLSNIADDLLWNNGPLWSAKRTFRKWKECFVGVGAGAIDPNDYVALRKGLVMLLWVGLNTAILIGAVHPAFSKVQRFEAGEP